MTSVTVNSAIWKRLIAILSMIVIATAAWAAEESPQSPSSNPDYSAWEKYFAEKMNDKAIGYS